MKMCNDKLNVHLYPSTLVFETRIEKIVEVINDTHLFEQVWVIGTGDEELPEVELRTNRIKFFRIYTSNKSQDILGKIIKFAKYYLSVWWMLRNESVGCINAHSLSVLPLAIILKFLKKSTVVYDTHELETETPSLIGVRRNIAKVVERIFIKHVNCVFCVSESIADWYKEEYAIKRPLVVLNSPEYTQISKSTYLRDRLSLSSEKIICLYFGLLEPHRGIEQLIKSFAILDKSKYVLVFIGYGSLSALIQASKSIDSNVFLLPPIKQSDLSQVACSADIGLCLIQPTSKSYDFCMPNKLFEYMSAGLPVIVGPCKSLIQFVNKNKIGVVAEVIEPEEIAASIQKLESFLMPAFNEHVRTVFHDTSWQSQAIILKRAYHEMAKEFN